MFSFYLASKSPRRRELLRSWGYRFEVLLADSTDSVNENVLEHESADCYVRRIAKEKALWGYRELLRKGMPLKPVLAADTTVTFEGRIFGKPASEEEAFEFLSVFNGRTHEVLTAMAVTASEKLSLEALSLSRVTFRKLSAREIWDYIKTGEPTDKAGAYGIQGKAGAFIERIDGSYTGIVGLSQTETVLMLEAAGIPYF